MGRVWVCMILYCSQIHYIHMVASKSNTRTEGVGLRKKPKDLSAHESEQRGHGEGGGVYVFAYLGFKGYQQFSFSFFSLPRHRGVTVRLFRNLWCSSAI